MISRDRFAPPDSQSVKHIRRAIALIDAFRQVEPSMPLSYAAAFLAVANEPGHGVTHYAKDLGVITPVASRIMLEIGKKARTGGPGYGLIDSQQSTTDLRAWSFYLTPLGAKLLQRVLAVLERNNP